MPRARRWLLAAVLAAAGCTLVTEFWKDENATPVQSFGPPSGYARSGFGTVVAAAQLDLGGDDGQSTLLAASAGPGSGAESYLWATQDGLRSDPHLAGLCRSPSGPADGVDSSTWGTCGDAGSGAALLWLPAFRFSGDAADCIGTLLVGQPLAGTSGAGRLAVQCPATGRAAGLDRGTGGADNFGRALALVPTSTGNRVAVGALHAVWVSAAPLTPGTTFDQPLDASGVTTDAFGTVLAAGHTADGGGWIAVGASTSGLAATDPSRVVLARPDPVTHRFTAAACLQASAHSPLGTVLAAADLDGDGDDELIYRTDAGDVGIQAGTAIAALVPAGGDPQPCDFDAPFAAPTAACPTGGDFGIDCSSDFAAALAVGDLDADGRPELLVGDPGAAVGGAAGAGAVHIYRADGTAWTPVGALFDASPQGNARLGAALAVARIDDRFEPFVGSPGSGEMFVFYCSGLDGDKPRAPDAAHPGTTLDGRCREQP